MNEVDKPGSDVEVYVKGLDKVLLKKIKIITDLREKLLNFYSHLKTEEHMSRLYERNLDAANQDETEDTQVSLNAQSNTTGLNVNNIHNGAYEDSPNQQNSDSLLNEVDGQLDDLEHLN